MAPPTTVAVRGNKGAVLQQNGHWGDQILAGHHPCIWLGPFRSEHAAAAASDGHRNLPLNESALYEPQFQALFPIEAVLAMIRDGSYETRFADYLRIACSPTSGTVPTSAAATAKAATALQPKLLPRDARPNGVTVDGVAIHRIFTKDLKPSDVGKLNRLVIPKRHATTHFPDVSPAAAAAETPDEMVLEFKDRESRTWAFRYCYWKSSQSYVFTRGWNKFVKDKWLRAGDRVVFYRFKETEGLRRAYFLIDIERPHGGAGGYDDRCTRSDSGRGRGCGGLGLGMRKKMEEDEEKGAVVESRHGGKKLKLFGATILLS